MQNQLQVYTVTDVYDNKYTDTLYTCHDLHDNTNVYFVNCEPDILVDGLMDSCSYFHDPFS